MRGFTCRRQTSWSLHYRYIPHYFSHFARRLRPVFLYVDPLVCVASTTRSSVIRAGPTRNGPQVYTKHEMPGHVGFRLHHMSDSVLCRYGSQDTHQDKQWEPSSIYSFKPPSKKKSDKKFHETFYWLSVRHDDRENITALKTTI